MRLPLYECNEQQFVENLRRLMEARVRFVVNRRITHYDDGRYGLSHLPDCEFRKYGQIARRLHQRSSVYAARPFLDDYHHRLYGEGVVLHSARHLNVCSLFIPYVKVEYSFTVWGETYRFEFDALYESEIRLERRDLSGMMKHRELCLRNGMEKHLEGKPMLVCVLSFKPPDEKMLRINLPPSVIVFDVRRMLRV